jgi:hypothetical protein
MAEKVMNRWDLEAILNRELHKHSQCSSCRFVGFADWNGDDDIFDHITVEGDDSSVIESRDVVEKIVAEARCTYEDAVFT